jgi:hypothetical protein
MRNNESNSSFSQNLFGSIRKYVDLKLEHVQLSFTERISILVGKIMLMLFFSILSLAILLLVVLLIYQLLMRFIGIGWLVMLIEIAFVGLLMSMLWIFREPLVINPTANMIIRAFYDSNENNDDEDKNESHEGL